MRVTNNGDMTLDTGITVGAQLVLALATVSASNVLGSITEIALVCGCEARAMITCMIRVCYHMFMEPISDGIGNREIVDYRARSGGEVLESVTPNPRCYSNMVARSVGYDSREKAASHDRKCKYP